MITTLSCHIRTLLTTLSAPGNKAWLDIPLAAVWGVQNRGKVVADRRDGEEKERERDKERLLGIYSGGVLT